MMQSSDHKVVINLRGQTRLEKKKITVIILPEHQKEDENMKRKTQKSRLQRVVFRTPQQTKRPPCSFTFFFTQLSSSCTTLRHFVPEIS